jgi:hypothetical protein
MKIRGGERGRRGGGSKLICCIKVFVNNKTLTPRGFLAVLAFK